jgi:hypothetical protein
LLIDVALEVALLVASSGHAPRVLLFGAESALSNATRRGSRLSNSKAMEGTVFRRWLGPTSRGEPPA